MNGKASGTRVEAVTVALRDMILRGELAAGQRVPEVELASSLKVSRTPVRVALGILEAEGLLDGGPNRGFTVRRFTSDHVLSAFDVRGALEGLACRVVAERGISRGARRDLESCLEVGSSLMTAEMISDVDMRRWAVANDSFHRAIIDAAELPALNDVYSHLSRLPLASPVAILFRGDQRDRAAELIRQSHLEHEQVYLALVRGESSRAEALVREHAYRSKLNVQLEMDHAPDGREGMANVLHPREWLGGHLRPSGTAR